MPQLPAPSKEPPSRHVPHAVTVAQTLRKYKGNLRGVLRAAQRACRPPCFGFRKLGGGKHIAALDLSTGILDRLKALDAQAQELEREEEWAKQLEEYRRMGE